MDLYVTAEEAAAELGVSLPTLYTYISRRGIRSKQIEGSKSKKYWRADIERMKAEKNLRSNSKATVGRQDSKITLVTPDGPYYRGRSAIELSETYTLEDTAALLWEADRSAIFGSQSMQAPSEIAGLYKLLGTSTVYDKAICILPFVERVSIRAFDFSHVGMCQTGADLMRWYTAIFADSDKPRTEPLHEQVAAVCGGDAEETDLIRRLLVISADHGFSAGTYAVRAVASTGVTLYRSVLAGLVISPGRRNMLGRREGILRLLGELASDTDPRTVIGQRLREGEQLPGFTIPAPYTGGDPRVRKLIEDVRRVRGDHPIFKKALTAFAYAEEELGLHPGFALVNALIAQIIGLPPGGEFLFTIGRCVGWIAHSIEQYEMGEIEPPATNYRGPLPEDCSV